MSAEAERTIPRPEDQDLVRPAAEEDARPDDGLDDVDPLPPAGRVVGPPSGEGPGAPGPDPEDASGGAHEPETPDADPESQAPSRPQSPERERGGRPRDPGSSDAPASLTLGAPTGRQRRGRPHTVTRAPSPEPEAPTPPEGVDLPPDELTDSDVAVAVAGPEAGPPPPAAPDPAEPGRSGVFVRAVTEVDPADIPLVREPAGPPPPSGPVAPEDIPLVREPEPPAAAVGGPVTPEGAPLEEAPREVRAGADGQLRIRITPRPRPPGAPPPSQRIQLSPRQQAAATPSGRTRRSAPRRRENAIRARVRRAMRCPYCRDEVERQGGVACARRGCGALYHVECWKECRETYGGCAVFGCGSRDAHGLSRVGFLVRLLRLFVAAFLFPPRVVQAMRQDGHGVAEIRAAIRDKARRAHTNMWTAGAQQERGYKWLNLVQLGVLASAYVLIFAVGWALGVDWEDHADYLLGALLVVPILWILGFYFVSWPLAVTSYWAKAVLEGEFAALARLEMGEGGYLGRMLRGEGKK